MKYPKHARRQVISKAIDFVQTQFGLLPIFERGTDKRKLTTEQVREIRRLHAIRAKSVTELARMNNVSRTTIHNIVNGKTYKDV